MTLKFHVSEDKSSRYYPPGGAYGTGVVIFSRKLEGYFNFGYITLMHASWDLDGGIVKGTKVVWNFKP